MPLQPSWLFSTSTTITHGQAEELLGLCVLGIPGKNVQGGMLKAHDDSLFLAEAY